MPYRAWAPQPYQPQITPFPQGVGYAFGEAANNFASNLIAAALYKRAQEQMGDEQSMRQLGLMGQYGGREALNAPGAQRLWGGLGHPGGMQLPPTPEEQIQRLLLERSQAQRTALGPQWGLPDAVIVQLLKQKSEEARDEANRRAFFGGGGMTGAGGLPQSPSVPGVSPMPPVPDETVYPPAPAPSAVGTEEGGLPSRFMYEEEIGLTPQGLTAKRTSKERPPNDPQVIEATAYKIRRTMLDSDAMMEQIRQLGKESGYGTGYSLMAHVNDQLRSDYGFSLPAEAPSLKAMRAAIEKKGDQGLAADRHKVELKRLDNALKNQDIQIANLQRLIEQGDRQTAAQVASLGINTQKTVIDSIKDRSNQLIRRITELGENAPEAKPLLKEHAEIEKRLADAIWQLQNLTQIQMDLLGGRVGNQRGGDGSGMVAPSPAAPPPTGGQSSVLGSGTYNPSWFRKKTVQPGE